MQSCAWDLNEGHGRIPVDSCTQASFKGFFNSFAMFGIQGAIVRSVNRVKEQRPKCIDCQKVAGLGHR
jgi:hypothetical protein